MPGLGVRVDVRAFAVGTDRRWRCALDQLDDVSTLALLLILGQLLDRNGVFAGRIDTGDGHGGWIDHLAILDSVSSSTTAVRTTKLCPGIATALVAACGAPQTAVTASDPPPALAIDLSVVGDGTSALAVHCAARNASSAPVHVFDWPKMPYLLDERGTLVVLHGVSPPPEAQDLNAIEIPTTRALAPGEELAFDVALVPLKLRNHYGEEPPVTRHGAAAIVCRVAHGATPIDAAARAHTTIATLRTWQQIDSSPTLVVRLP